MHARPRAFPFVSLNFRTVSDRLRRKKRKKKKRAGYQGTCAPFLFSPALGWWRLSQHNSREPQTVFRAFVSVDTQTRMPDFVPHPLSPHRVWKFRNLFGVFPSLFFFFFFVWFQRDNVCTFISLSDIISYKISYVKFLIQIFNSFTTRYATEMRSSIQATNKRRIVVLSKGLSKE